LTIHSAYQHIRPPRPIAAGTRIGHVHLKVANLERALGFYVGVLGFELVTTYNDQAAFISAGGYHHHIGLNTWESLGGSPPAAGTTGLFHTAILYPSRAELGDALRRLDAAGIPLDGRDRPEAEWPRDEAGNITMFTRRLDVEALRREGA
jgi:catechol 2,3-dioxygenase